MNPILKVVLTHLETMGSVATLRVDGWELPVEAGQDGRPHFIVEPGDAGFDHFNRKTLSFSVSAWMNNAEEAYDIAFKLCDSLNRRSLINESGWIERIEILAGAEALPPMGQERIAGAEFSAIATLKV